MVLDNYIKQDFVKQVFMESCLIVSDINQAEYLARTLKFISYNLIFETSYIKYIFFSKLKVYYPEIKIINCDSSKSRLINDINSYSDELIVFDKVNYCIDFDIFNMIKRSKKYE